MIKAARSPSRGPQKYGVEQVKSGSNVDARERTTLRNVLPLVALGGSLAAAPAGALELGELTVQSNLGQPLRASIAYALAPNEMLSDTCVAVSAGRSTGGLPGIGRNSVSITERAIVITGEAAVREPMLGTRVTINCPYTPNLSREYMLFVDPAGVANAQAAAVALPATRPQAEPQASVAPTTAVRSPATDTPIGQATRYQVQPGDTLSEIVRRIENRSMSLWPAVNTVFAANPDAFIDNDPNKLKAGSWLTIPSLDGTAPVIAAAETTGAERRADAPSVTVDDAQAAPGSMTDVESVSAYQPAEFDAPSDLPEETVASTDSTADLKPGDVVPESMLPAPAETIDIPDTELAGPQTASASPNVPTAIISTGARSESTSTFMWLLGGGLAIVAALLLFGRRVRNRFGSTLVGREVAERDTRQADAAEDTAAIAEYDIDDDSPTQENLTLDADLEIGTGLQAGVEVDDAQDFGFAATTNLDIELPFEPEAPVTDSSSTGIDGTDDREGASPSAQCLTAESIVFACSTQAITIASVGSRRTRRFFSFTSTIAVVRLIGLRRRNSLTVSQPAVSRRSAYSAPTPLILIRSARLTQPRSVEAEIPVLSASAFRPFEVAATLISPSVVRRRSRWATWADAARSRRRESASTSPHGGVR